MHPIKYRPGILPLLLFIAVASLMFSFQALFLDDLIQHFKANGWEVIDADEAFEDKIYQEVPNAIPAGESLIWALAKQSGRFEKVLRYPAEDGEYEKVRMDKLGL